MAAPMFVLGMGGYIVAGLIFANSPSITQEIFAALVATNATLFLVGGAIVAAMTSREKA
ncbi:hypothetical protein [Antarcticirhabdus aurantiaca]|uniref:Uncharacterized protein n=1 Tax=Antarcticirhabdus aurantiaca TaxID=2606717 RepID=A0ACD4NWD8_9HYPH|nr:hypothetical protein OXU80_12370 [Jeongeuplla avenae]